MGTEKISALSFTRTILHIREIGLSTQGRFYISEQSGKRIKPILEKYKDKFRLVYLPAYSPDLNPIERIWLYMRKKISHNRYLETMNNRIEKFKELIKTFEPKMISTKPL